MPVFTVRLLSVFSDNMLLGEEGFRCQITDVRRQMTDDR
jgi:hypothetical protein